MRGCQKLCTWRFRLRDMAARAQLSSIPQAPFWSSGSSSCSEGSIQVVSHGHNMLSGKPPFFPVHVVPRSVRSARVQLFAGAGLPSLFQKQCARLPHTRGPAPFSCSPCTTLYTAHLLKAKNLINRGLKLAYFSAHSVRLCHTAASSRLNH